MRDSLTLRRAGASLALAALALGMTSMPAVASEATPKSDAPAVSVTKTPEAPKASASETPKAPAATPTPKATENAAPAPAPKVPDFAPLPKSADRYKIADGTYKIGNPLPGGKGAGIIPAGLESFYKQKIEWGSCLPFGARFQNSKDGECGYLIVPIDYTKPALGTIAIGVIRFKATGTSKGALLWNPGGPGGSGMGLVNGVSDKSPRKDWDLIGFDPRGTGASLPYAQCLTNKQIDKKRAIDPTGDLAKDEADGIKGTKDFVKACYENTGKQFNFTKEQRTALMQNLGTRDAVKDIDTLRSALEQEKLHFVGYSYGTRLGYVYAQTFPKNVGHSVLDGAVNPVNNGQSSDNSQIASFQKTLNEFAKWCAKNVSEKKTYGQVSSVYDDSPLKDKPFECGYGTDATKLTEKQFTERYQSLVRPLIKTPIKNVVGDGRPLSFQDAVLGTISALYNDASWPYLNQGLLSLHDRSKEGSGRLMMLLADQYMGRSAQGVYDSGDAAFTAIRCADGGANVDLNSAEGKAMIAKIREHRKKAYAVAPFTDPGVEPTGEPDYCAVWGFNGTLPKSTDIKGVSSQLVISTSHDPATPYQSGVNLAKLIHGVLLSVQGARHGAFLMDIPENKCVDEITNTYLKESRILSKAELEKIENHQTCSISFPGAEISAGNTKYHRGDTVTVTALGLAPNAEVKFTLNSKPVDLGTHKTDGTGTVTFKFNIPNDIEFGKHTVTAKLLGYDLPDTAIATLEVVAPNVGAPGKDKGIVVEAGGPKPVKSLKGTKLAKTGAESNYIFAFGGLVAVLGVGALVARRKFAK